MRHERAPRPPRLTRLTVGVAATLAVLLGAAVAGASAPSSRRIEPREGWPVVVIVLDGLDWAWVNRYALSGQTPHLEHFVREAALAVYNPLAADPEPVGAYLSAATGNRVEAAGPVTLGAGERARRVVERRAGHPPPQAAYYLLNLPRLAGEARKSGSFTPPGWLGRMLRGAGIRTVLLGDAGWVSPAETNVEAQWVARTSPMSLAALLMADGMGAVEQAYPLFEEDPGAAGGLRTRWGELPRVLRALAAGCAGCEAGRQRAWLAVAASGDLWRLRREESELAAPAREAHHRTLAAELDRVAEWWASDPLWGRGSLLLFGAAPGPAGRQSGELLTAMIWKGPWGPGAIHSASARRAGFVPAVDLAPTLASLADVPAPPGVVGRPLAFGGPQPEPGHLEEFARVRAGIWRGRFRVMSALITAQVLVLAAGLARAALAGPMGCSGVRAGWVAAADLRRPFPFAIAWAAAVPLALLNPWAAAPLAALPPGSAAGVAWAILAASWGAAAVAWVAVKVSRRFDCSAAFIIGALTAGAIVCDLVFRLDLVARSFMGYDLIAGARFYGIGNEHMGLLLGFSLVAAAEAGERWPRLRPPVALTLLAVAWLVAEPGRGANVGGAIATATAFGAAVLGWEVGSRPDLKAAAVRGAAGAVLAGLLVAAAALADTRGGAPGGTHLARTLEMAHTVGLEYVVSVATRKLALNWRLLRYSLYSRAMVVAMVVVMAAFWAPGGGLRRVLMGRPRLRLALEASALGAAAALLANDSGVTAAAGALLGPAALVLELAVARGGGRAGRGGGVAPGP